jgi:hypothetical protein
MKTFLRTVQLHGPTLVVALRATRRITLLVASLAVVVTACGPVGVVSPPGLDPDTTDVAEVTEAETPREDPEEVRDSWLPDVGVPNGAPEDPPIPAPDCQRTGPMVPC